MTAPRLLLLTQYWPPEMGAPQGRLSELGERLIDRGWTVEALTALPNYPTGRVFAGYDPRRVRVERVGRIRTVRLPLLTSGGGYTRRLISYLSLAVTASVAGPGLVSRADLLYVESPPLFLGPAAWYVSARLGAPYVLNVSDLWPESAIRMGIVGPGVRTRAAEALELALYRRALGVTGQSDEILAWIGRRSPTTPTHLVTNGVDVRRFGRQHADDEARALLGHDPGPVFIFAGLLGLAQGLDQILDLARGLPPSTPGRFVLVGDGPERQHLVSRIATEGLASRIRVIPSQPRHRIPALLACADAAVITLGYDIEGAVPSKIYEAMAASLPILLVASGEPARRVRSVDAGLVVPPRSPAELHAAYVLLATDAALRKRLGAAGRAAAETTYDREAIASGLSDFLRLLIGRPASAP